MRLTLNLAAACAINLLLFLGMMRMIATDPNSQWIATTDAEFFRFGRPRTAMERAPQRKARELPPEPVAEPPPTFQELAGSRRIPAEDLRALPLPTAALKVDIPLAAEINIGSGPSLPPIISGGTSRTGPLGAAPGTGAGSGRGIAERNFLMADELVAIARLQPVYPDQLRFRRIEGEVLVEFLVTATGEVRNARVIESSPGGSFDRAALTAIRRWRFQPRRDEAGKPVPVRVRQHFKFTLR